MRKLSIVIGVVKQGELYMLQLRNGDPKIGGAGLVGFFGGKIEADEDPASAVCRELSEETSLRPEVDSIRPLGMVTVVSDHQLEQVEVTAHVFSVPVAEDLTITAYEGELVTMSHDEAMSSLDTMTTGTRACFEELLTKTEE